MYNRCSFSLRYITLWKEWKEVDFSSYLCYPWKSVRIPWSYKPISGLMQLVE